VVGRAWRVGAALLVAAATAAAQPAPEVRIALPASGAYLRDGPTVGAAFLLVQPRTRDLLAAGFAARLTHRVELWRTGRWFDEVERGVTWDLIVRWDAVARAYRVVRVADGRIEPVGSFQRLDDADRYLARPSPVPLVPPRTADRCYYVLTLGVEVLSVSDLDEVERWLRGELTPSLRGDRPPETALGRGVRSLAARLLGGEAKTYEARTGRFRPTG
jgi:hypothetical protein